MNAIAMLDDFVAGLRGHDASMALALSEVVRRADETGGVDRGEFLISLRSAFAETTDTVGPWGASAQALHAHETTDSEALARYVEENVISRLEAGGLAVAEPAGPNWERICVAPGLWGQIAARKDDVADQLAVVAGNLLATATEVVSPGTEVQAPNTLVTGGSRLAARGLVKAYKKRNVVNHVDLEVSQGEIVGLLGPNGAGKTTTFYTIVGLIKPDEGRIVLDDQVLTGVPMYKRARRGIGYLAQEPSIFRRLSVEANIMAILETLPLSRAERKARLETLLDELSIKHLRKEKAYSLSGGERRRLEITRALVSEPKFMLLDEPFAGVDPIAVHDIQQIVAGLRHRGIGVVISDHNVEQTLDIVDRAYIMYDGRVRVSGTVAELVWNEEVAEIYFGPTLTARMRERYRRPELS